jgi:hypothetical protein
MRYRVLGLTVLGILLAAGSVSASYTVKFGDTAAYWPGYKLSHPEDEIGVPIFPYLTAGLATLSNDKKLQSVTFSYQSGSAVGWSLLKPGDLFLDVDSADGWDYVVHHSGNDWALYSFADIALSQPDAYQVVQASAWPGYTVRTGHPWALRNDCVTANGTGIGDVAFDGWKNLGAGQTGTSTFDFSGLPLGGLEVDRLLLGFTVNCANDVIYESISLPEPASVVVWGLLSLTFAGGSWRLAFLRRPPRSPKAH